MSQSTAPNKARVLIVDDHPIVRHGLTFLINNQDDLEVCAEAETIRQALAAASEVTPDIALVDLSLKDESGLDLIKDLRARHPSLPILAVSIHSEALYAARTIKAGAKGYVAKQEATFELLAAIRKVLAGQIYVSERIATHVMNVLAGGADATEGSMDLLSNRELQVLQLIGSGKTTREIAQALHLSIKTIETYRGNIKQKLSLENATKLVQFATTWVQKEGV